MNKTNKNKSYIFHRRLDYCYPIITHGKGIWLYDKSGESYKNDFMICVE